MKYTLDTIPVLDAYKADCECPLCKLRILCVCGHHAGLRLHGAGMAREEQ